MPGGVAHEVEARPEVVERGRPAATGTGDRHPPRRTWWQDSTPIRKECSKKVVNILWQAYESSRTWFAVQIKPRLSRGLIASSQNWPAALATIVQDLRCGLRTFTHLGTAAALAVLRRHGALAPCAAGHAGLILRHHGASLAILALAAATAVAARLAFATASSSLAAASHSAVRLIMITAGARLGIVAAGSRRRLGCALRHQRQSHHYCAQYYENFRFHISLRILVE